MPEGALISPNDIMSGRSTTMAEALPNRERGRSQSPGLVGAGRPFTVIVEVSRSLVETLLSPCLCLFCSSAPAPPALGCCSWRTAPPSFSYVFPQEWGKYKYTLRRILRPPWKWRSTDSISLFNPLDHLSNDVSVLSFLINRLSLSISCPVCNPETPPLHNRPVRCHPQSWERRPFTLVLVTLVSHSSEPIYVNSLPDSMLTLPRQRLRCRVSSPSLCQTLVYATLTSAELISSPQIPAQLWL
jgi:hypothetical protein